MFLYSSWQQKTLLGTCDYVVHYFCVSYQNLLCFVVACSVLFVRNMGDKLLEHRINIKCSTEFKKNAHSSYSEYI